MPPKISRDYTKDRGKYIMFNYNDIIYNHYDLNCNFNVLNIMNYLILFILLEKLKTFLTEFVMVDDITDEKTFKYRKQLTNIAHREQVDLIIELDDVHEFDDELAMCIVNNTRRYVNLLLEVNYVYIICNITKILTYL